MKATKALTRQSTCSREAYRTDTALSTLVAAASCPGKRSTRRPAADIWTVRNGRLYEPYDQFDWLRTLIQLGARDLPAVQAA